MAENGTIVKMKSKKELEEAAKNAAGNPAPNDGGTGEEKLSFWKHPFKVTKIKVTEFNEKHPKVKWVIAGIVTLGVTTVTAFATGLFGDKKDDSETIETWTSDEESTEEEDSEVEEDET